MRRGQESDVGRSVYKRLETDAEFLARIKRDCGRECGREYARYIREDVLDEIAWRDLKVQRRIIEAES